MGVSKTSYMCKRLYWESCFMYYKNDKYLASIIDNSVVTCDEIEEETKTVTTNFNKKKSMCKTKNFYFFTCLFINYNCIIDSC